MSWKTKEERNTYQQAYRRAHGVLPRRAAERRLCRICKGPVPPQNRAFCSMACQQIDRNNEVRRWVAGETNPTDKTEQGRVPEWIKRWWFDEYGERCVQCGWGERHPITGRVPLTWDHVDGDCTNNRRANLRLLCPNCQALTPTFAGFDGHRSKRRRWGNAWQKEA